MMNDQLSAVWSKCEWNEYNKQQRMDTWCLSTPIKWSNTLRFYSKSNQEYLMIQRAPFFYPKSNQEWISFKWSNTTLSFYPKSNSNFKMNILLIDNPLKSSFPILVMISNTWQWLKKQQIIFILKSKKFCNQQSCRDCKEWQFPRFNLLSIYFQTKIKFTCIKYFFFSLG